MPARSSMSEWPGYQSDVNLSCDKSNIFKTSYSLCGICDSNWNAPRFHNRKLVLCVN